MVTACIPEYHRTITLPKSKDFSIRIERESGNVVTMDGECPDRIPLGCIQQGHMIHSIVSCAYACKDFCIRAEGWTGGFFEQCENFPGQGIPDSYFAIFPAMVNFSMAKQVFSVMAPDYGATISFQGFQFFSCGYIPYHYTFMITRGEHRA